MKVQPDERTAGHADAPALHEPSDVSGRGVHWFVAGLIVFLGVVGLVVAWMFQAMATREDRIKASVYSLAVEVQREGRPLPPAPRLEGIDPHRERVMPMDADGYGWSDEKRGLARVPLDRARERARSSGLLRSREGDAGQSGFGMIPSDASSGRLPWRGRP